jgi:PAS domain S-box-containing protein
MFDGVLIAAPGGRVVMVNDAAARIFGVPRNELLVPIGEYPDRFGLREVSGARPVPVALRALKGEIVAPIERLIRTPGGSQKTVRTSAAPIRDEDGTISGAVVLVADVTAAAEEVERERERAAALQASYGEALHAAELLELGDAFFELDRDWRIVRVNARQELLSRKPRSETLGRTFAEVWPELAHPDSRYSREYHRCMDARVPVQFQAYHAPLGMWTGVTAYPVSGGGIAVFLREVTELKRAEEALRESEARARAISENIRDALAVLHAVRGPAGDVVDWRCLDANEGVLAMLGAPRDAVVGRSPRELAPDLSPGVHERLARVLASGERERYEAAFRGRSFLMTAFRVDADTVGCAAIDITERKQAEEAVREADRRKTEFLGVLSHELRNPLAPIRNGIFLLERLPPHTPQAARARQAIRRQTEHLTRLIDDLLDVTRISRGKIHLHPEVVDLRNLVRRTCEDHRLLFDECELELRLDFPVAPVWADVDATRITQVVGNLLQNASKFTPPRGAVSVALRSGGGRATVVVKDTGLGIEPAEIVRIFEPFAQEDRSLARTRGGLGLGLALAKGLVELHGGTIAARSAGPGKGSEFTVALPLSGRRPVAALPPAGAPANGARRRVLVIEDNVDSARTLADVLEVEGHEVTLARDGTTGIALARKLRPEVVICDIGLPDVDGYEVARTLRADPSLRSITLIALSGYAQPEDRERARDAGFEAHLPKPAPLDDLAALVTAASGGATPQ